MKDSAEVKQLTEEDKQRAFIADLEAVMKKHQMRLVNTPVYKFRDDGTFSTVIQTTVAKISG